MLDDNDNSNIPGGDKFSTCITILTLIIILQSKSYHYTYFIDR